MPVLIIYYDITVNQLVVLCLADRRTGMKFMMRFGTGMSPWISCCYTVMLLILYIIILLRTLGIQISY